MSQRDIYALIDAFSLFPQDVFNSLPWSFFKTFIMMIGEIDYGSIVVDAKDQHNEETGAPLAPIPEFSAVIICLFCVMVSVILMNLLVSVRYKYLHHGVENTANQNARKPLYSRHYYTQPSYHTLGVCHITELCWILYFLCCGI